MNTASQKYIHELHTEHITYLSTLAFAKDEIKTFNNRLSEIVTANTKKEILAQVEHFQNQFIRHNEVIDELKHEVHECETRIAKIAESNNVATDHKKVDDHADLRDQMDTFSHIFSELKNEFKSFLEKAY
jgi:Asp-tRNA(Asn)/Glu-tRNA(Gln) amidotransferase C subunit